MAPTGSGQVLKDQMLALGELMDVLSRVVRLVVVGSVVSLIHVSNYLMV